MFELINTVVSAIVFWLAHVWHGLFQSVRSVLIIQEHSKFRRLIKKEFPVRPKILIRIEEEQDSTSEKGGGHFSHFPITSVRPHIIRMLKNLGISIRIIEEDALAHNLKVTSQIILEELTEDNARTWCFNSITDSEPDMVVIATVRLRTSESHVGEASAWRYSVIVEMMMHRPDGSTFYTPAKVLKLPTRLKRIKKNRQTNVQEVSASNAESINDQIVCQLAAARASILIIKFLLLSKNVPQLVVKG